MARLDQGVVNLHTTARQLYRHGPLFGRAVQSLRPYICPFDRIVPLVPPGSDVLDVGCGAGLFLGLLAVRGRLKSGLGFDASSSAIALAEQMRQSLPAQHRERLSFERRDVGDAWPADLFDVVALIDVMHHVPPPGQRALLEQAAARVRPGGLFLYKDMARRPRWRAFANRLHDLVMARQWIHYLPLDVARRWGTDCRLSIEEEGRCAMLWYAHEWLVFRKPSAPPYPHTSCLSHPALCR
jgi:2-polyprenyl-3-methyl-5-hydroxy-6-metoxy-1,4-benzoquinol methylase